jgi:2-amino-4-hydroxy-6-hydroxymethyldihydropteridine diphosphokinase
MVTVSKQFLIALGANLPVDQSPPVATIRHALDALAESGFRDLVPSRLFATPCFPPGAGPDYVNAAARATAPDGWDARRVLAELHKVEDHFGRQRAQRWGMRTLDLDLIAFGDAVLPDAETHAHWLTLDPQAQRVDAPDQLILPHPRMQDRAFVLVPLADVAPDWRHPTLGLTVKEMLARLPATDRAEVRPI